MNTVLVSCTKCNAPLLGDVFNLRGLVPCPSCGTPLHVDIFPAMFRRIAPGQDGEVILEELEASCFYHPQKKAVLPCEGCGRFVCALCDCVLHGQHLCPACLETGRTKRKIKSLENRRVLHDDIAVSFAIFSIIPYFFWFAAPASIYISMRHWKTPTSIVPRTKLRYIFAILLSTCVLAGWILGIYLLIHASHRLKTH